MEVGRGRLVLRVPEVARCGLKACLRIVGCGGRMPVAGGAMPAPSGFWALRFLGRECRGRGGATSLTSAGEAVPIRPPVVTQEEEKSARERRGWSRLSPAGRRRA